MKKIFLIPLSLTLIFTSTFAAELSGDITFSYYDDISRSSIGIGGMIFPETLSRSKFSLGFDLGLEFIDRHLKGAVGPYYYSEEQLYTGDSAIIFVKEYNDFLFIPFGAVLRYDFGDPGNFSRIRPSIFIGLGGILNLRQKSYRDIGNILSGSYWQSYSSWEYGSKSISTFDFYLKPRIALYWHRAYLSYEHHFNTEYIIGSVSAGYIFRL